MRIARISLLMCILAAAICVFFFLYHRFEGEIHAFLHSLRLYALILLPVFFVIGIFLFLEDKWSIISTLSLVCLFVIAISGYGCLMAAFSSPAYDDEGGVEARLIRIFIAEFAIILLMITNVIKSYREEKRASENHASQNEMH